MMSQLWGCVAAMLMVLLLVEVPQPVTARGLLQPRIAVSERQILGPDYSTQAASSSRTRQRRREARVTRRSRKSLANDQPNEYGGSRAVRMVQFWARAFDIYSSYKLAQAKIGLMSSFIQDPKERDSKAEEWWSDEHERNSDKMLQLCLDLRGFYLKAGQFLGTRGDFMPLPYIRKLSTLHDRVPPISEAQVRQVVMEELGDRSIDQIFSFLNLTAPVGSASICQVHEGRLRHNNERVAVKIQYPNAERIMRSDLANLKTLSAYLKTFELKFDLVSMCVELQKQISQEFDFHQEAKALRTVGRALERAVPTIQVPKPYLVTRRLLVMSFLDGTQITRLADEKKKSKRAYVSGLLGLTKMAERRAAKALLDRMAAAWGYMLFKDEMFHADPHPGNILVMPGMRLGLLDWGQTKRLDPDVREQLARLYVALGRGSDTEIVREFQRLGIKTEKPEDIEDTVRMAINMFDTSELDGNPCNPFSKEHGLSKNAVLSFPSDLAYVLRSVQIMRGMATNMGIPKYSVMRHWAPIAEELLQGSASGGSIITTAPEVIGVKL